MGWGLGGLLLLGAEARAREPVMTLAGLKKLHAPEPVAPPLHLTPWRSTFHLDGPHRWMRQALWAGTWGGAWEENVADFVVPYPVPEAVMYVTTPQAELLVEPSPAALHAGPFLPYAPVSVLRSAPWLPPGFVAVFVKGRVTGFLPRGVLSEAPPPVERLLAEARAALEGRELERVQKLAWAARELYAGDARTLALVRALRLSEDEWMPPELVSPGAELPAPGAHVTPGASLYVGSPLLPLFKRRSTAGAAPQSWLAINTAVLVLDVAGGWARVRETLPAEQAALVGRDGAVQWRSWPKEFEEQEAREGYVVARYLEDSPVDPRALRALARSPRTKDSPEETLALLERAFAAEPWNEEVRLDAFEWALKRKLAARLPPSAPLPVRADAVEVLMEGPSLAREAFGVPADAPEVPGLEAVLYYGCGGDVLRAGVLSEQDAVLQEELANGTSGLSADMCLKDVDAAPPQPPPRHLACPEISGEEDTPEHRAALDREEAEARKQYETKLRPEFEARLKQLREHFPQGPYLCVTVSNPAPRPRVNLRVQYYGLPAVEEACESPSKRPPPRADPLRVGEVVVPYLGSDAKVDLCIEVPRYEGMLYGVLLAPDVKAAELFIQRLAWIRREAETSEEATYWEYEEALHSLLPHATVSTEWTRACEETCY